MTNPADGAPLTRRQLRELAEAEAAKAAQSAPGAQGSPGFPAAQQPQQAPPSQPSFAQPPLTRTAQPAAQPSQQMPVRGPSSAPGQPITRSAGSPTSQPGGLPSRQSAVPSATDQPGGMPRRTASAERTIPAGAGTGYVPAGQASPGQPLSRVEQIRSQQSQAVAQSSGSRRAMRESTEPPAAVIVPPRQTGKIRTLDETGELGAMRDHSPAAPSLPPRSASPQAPSAPVRRTSAVGAQPGGTSAAAGLPTFTPGAAPAAGTPWDSGDAATTRQGRGQAAPADAGESWQPGGFDENPWAPVTPRSEAPVAQAHPAPVLPADGAPFAVSSSPDEEVPTELPQWDAITAGGPVRADLDPDPLDLDEDDVEEFVEPDHKYTWLHYLILIAVAFVFGLIIWKVGFENRAEGLSGTTDEISTAGVPGLSLNEDFL